MSLTRFVRNVDDLSDDGGYKFRFRCDSCSDGVESRYVRSSANVLKTGLQVFSMFRYFGWGSTAVDGVDRGLRGKEHDAAYETAVNEASVQFSKCSHCGGWVCGHCWNEGVGLCERCAPDRTEAAAVAGAGLARDRAALAARRGGPPVGRITCPVCGNESGGGRFCQHCGTPVAAERHCTECSQVLVPGVQFCGRCGTRVR